jgi:L-ascorbate metabolism protein UlaG (beta-lactamase superfamily)
MEIHFLRHATSMVNLGEITILVDPMFSPAGSLDPPPHTPNPRPVPLVALPLDNADLQRLVDQVDAVLVTHTHRDHWDQAAMKLIPPELPLFCQPEDEATLRHAGFTSLLPIFSSREWRGVHLTRTGGQHGTGEIGRQLGPVSGFVLKTANNPKLYITGDTVWCPEVQEALTHQQPEVTLAYSGAAQFLRGGPITMTAEDICTLCRTVPHMQVIAIHLEAWNHCLLTRAGLQEKLRREGLSDRVRIPADGELISL